LVKICDYSKVNRSLLLAVLLIDDNDTHEYFGHKYNISNDLKEDLNFFAKNLKLIKKDKDFLNKNLEKNIYLFNKNNLIKLNILNFVINPIIKLKDCTDILSKILKSKTHKLNIDGKYLIENGMQQGSQVGEALKKIEEEWIKNNFKINKEQVNEIIRLHSN